MTHGRKTRLERHKSPFAVVERSLCIVWEDNNGEMGTCNELLPTAGSPMMEISWDPLQTVPTMLFLQPHTACLTFAPTKVNY